MEILLYKLKVYRAGIGNAFEENMNLYFVFVSMQMKGRKEVRITRTSATEE